MVLTRGMAGNNDGQIMVRTCQSIKKKSHIVSNRVASRNNYALCRSVLVTNLFVYMCVVFATRIRLMVQIMTTMNMK